jgi:ribosome maturation factor RimP
VAGSLEPAAKGLGLSLVEVSVSGTGGDVRIRLVIHKKGTVGIDDCTAFHRAALPELELVFPGGFSLEVSSPGTDRRIKDGAEFASYLGESVRCYCTDVSDWVEGVLESSDGEGISLRGDRGSLRIGYGVIAKAKLGNS